MNWSKIGWNVCTTKKNFSLFFCFFTYNFFVSALQEMDQNSTLNHSKANPLATVYARRLASQDSVESWLERDEVEHRKKARVFYNRFRHISKIELFSTFRSQRLAWCTKFHTCNGTKGYQCHPPGTFIILIIKMPCESFNIKKTHSRVS